jgi:hypothetical protein
MKLNSTTSMVLLAFLVFGALIAAAALKNAGPSQYDELAQCIDEAGGKMYGAYWCSACEQQKADFGSAFKHVEYVECSSPGSHTFDLCPDIVSTPTWEKADRSQFTGARSLSDLAAEFGCEDKI